MAEDRDDLAAEVFLAIVKDDLALLRRFRGQSSLATYLPVVSRRIVVHELLKKKSATSLSDLAEPSTIQDDVANDDSKQRFEDHDEVERLLDSLQGPEG